MCFTETYCPGNRATSGANTQNDGSFNLNKGNSNLEHDGLLCPKSRIGADFPGGSNMA